MITDVTLRYPARTLVIECKYTDCLVTGQFLEKRLKSQHLYELSTYLRNLAYREGSDGRPDGILLYPSTTVTFRQEYVLHGHRLRLTTVDLSKSPAEIEEQMIALTDSAVIPDRH